MSLRFRVALIAALSFFGGTVVGLWQGVPIGKKHRDAEMKEVVAFREHKLLMADWTTVSRGNVTEEERAAFYTFELDGNITMRHAVNREGRVLVVSGNGALQILPFIIPDDKTKIIIQGSPALHTWK